jgi:hypothetical protein
MDLRETPDAKEKRLFGIVEKHIKSILRDAPAYGSVKAEFILVDGQITRVIYGAEVARKLHNVGAGR